ncbi:periplasmic binding protein-like II [Armillaria luteobubalina]|uniref:Periplasmic binding protein-like II n=1 Tax=Armillaria luteobubalina TaxID=153913 RepID=A0AA39QCI8_9AGAR|nr:periplasmic binding protein-like II [Armillaria luteobubalina]
MPLRIGYVREHFSSPLLQYAQADQNKTFTLVECPSGTGQLISRLTNDEIDVAIALTDPLISGIANGSKAYKLVGSYVSTPLNWAVITGTEAKYNSISDLKDTAIGISRQGSGSQTMAYVMALQQGWPSEDLKFKINNDIHGLIKSVNDGSTSAFMWEWFTTKPFVDAKECRFIGSVPTPWPSWLIAARTTTPPDDLRDRASRNVEFIKTHFGYPEEDILAWLKTVGYPDNCLTIETKVITDTLSVLQKAGVVKGEFDVSQFVDTAVVTLV